MTRERAAELLSDLVESKLLAAGLNAESARISPAELSAFLEGKGKGVRVPDTSVNVEVHPTRGGTKGTSIGGSSSISTSGKFEETVTAPSKCKAPDTSVRDQVQAVWDHWLKVNGQAATVIDARSEGKITDRLAYGFTVQELIAVIDAVVADPALVNRKRVLAISRPLESDARVCALLGKPYERAERVTWLTPFDKAWKAHYGAGELAFGPFAKVATRLVGQHSLADVLAEFQAYIERTGLDYVNWHKFQSGFGAWSTAARPGRGREGLNQGDMVKGIW